MELSRKKKFEVIKKTKKWPKVLLAAVFALMLGTTSVFAVKPQLADYLYNEIMRYTFQEDINKELLSEKENILAEMKERIATIFSSAKDELEQKKINIIADEKAELREQYESEMETIKSRKQEAMDKKTDEMESYADRSTEKYKEQISNAIEVELKKH
jgi:hypothetical protein